MSKRSTNLTNLVVLSSFALGGCGLITPPEIPPQSVDGAKPINFTVPGDTQTQMAVKDLPEQVGAADLGNATGMESARYRRNYLIGFYMHESDVNCTMYLQNLTKTQREYGLIFGSLATIFGGAGAAFTQASVARPLSALAGISSAERAEIDADTFAKQTSQVIIAGIKNSRVRAYNEIVQTKFALPVTDWPLSLALADVQDYHRRCSLNEGVTEAAASINAVAPSAADTAQRTSSAGRSEGPPSISATKAITTNAAAVGTAAALQQANSSAATVSTGVQGAVAGGSTTQNAPAAGVANAAAAAGRAVVSPAPPPTAPLPAPAAQAAQAATRATTDSAMRLDEWLHPNGKLSIEHRDALLAWLKTQTVEPTVPKTPFSEILLNKPGYEAVRQAAVKDLVK